MLTLKGSLPGPLINDSRTLEIDSRGPETEPGNLETELRAHRRRITDDASQLVAFQKEEPASSAPEQNIRWRFPFQLLEVSGTNPTNSIRPVPTGRFPDL